MQTERRTSISEEELVDVYRRCIGPLYSYTSRRIGGERQLAEDIVQEAFLRGLSCWHREGLPRSPLAWLKTVASNLLASHYRRVQPKRLEEIRWEPEATAWEPAGREEAALLGRGLSLLSESQAHLLEAFHFEGKRVRELAQEMGISERAVEGRLRRARAALRRALEKIFA